jgi:hypothetical protein
MVPYDMLTRASLLEFLRQHRYAVQATAAPGGGAQAAVVGIAVSDRFELVFDTLDSTRKTRNLAHDARIAVVLGGLVEGEAQTVQYEGLADRPGGDELRRLQDLYLSVFPDGRERWSWPGLVYVRVRPTWMRYSDFRTDPPRIVELDAAAIAGLL